ncbi:hypothetical protein B1R94_08625 [Mycolicibacterium litorale]|nr:hypothetical protein B1R94_08625 [Mycolicibacterium litorale]
MDVVDFSLAASQAIRQELARLGNADPQDALRELGLEATDGPGLADLLFRYELEGFYCNRKTHADRINAQAERIGNTTVPGFQSVKLNGQTPLHEISEVIRRVERESRGTPPEQRLASIAGTSLISHGVDLARLNVLFVLGMPSTIAYYVQATSRAGRTDVGVVFTALTRHFVRDRSVFHFFEAQHKYVNVLVEPVALNRFSTHGPRKTASGIVAAVLTQHWARDADVLSQGGMTAPTDLTRAENVRSLLNRMKLAAESNDQLDPLAILQEQVRCAYGLDSEVLDQSMSTRFAGTVNREVQSLMASIEAAHEFLLTKSLRPRPPTSLRDVDASADFGTVDYPARRRFEFLDGTEFDNDENDFNVAEEGS